MLSFLSDYGLFVAKTLTIVLALLLLVGGIALIASRNRRSSAPGEISVTSLNERLEDMQHSLESAIMDKESYKALLKEEHKKEKAEAKARRKALKKKGGSEEEGEGENEKRRRVFVLDFDGDIRASEVEPLREEISAVLTLATPEDEVVMRLESAGGLVHTYGLAASQLERFRAQNIPLTVCVDRVAASGGYMMACLADRLLAAPFAVLGSIGVVAQMPNFHKLLKKHDIDYEVLTAGEFKRTLTMFGENTDKGREKFIEELEDTHELFKEFVSSYRPQLDIRKVATGEIWFGKRALEEKLVDEICTSDDYLMKASKDADVFSVRYEEKKSLQERLSDFAVSTGDRLMLRWWDRLYKSRLLSR
ncbi:protease SohB [Marinobacterium nitratireducens]|uniref:Protease SohB n=1 Tax=Marinobacterium nitratireducens TaxID=518897 RepID=A0A917ZC80_9GAMM|nr:protease SohB [Marinobacterium nitratireducens]GGO80568.1 protease SohB [Marinobacterium nitratireducens]